MESGKWKVTAVCRSAAHLFCFLRCPLCTFHYPLSTIHYHLRGGAAHGILQSLKNPLFGVKTEEPALDKDTIKDVREQLVTAQDALLQTHNTIEGADASTKNVFGYTEQVNMTTFQIQILGTVKTLQDMIKTVDGLLDG